MRYDGDEYAPPPTAVADVAKRPDAVEEDVDVLLLLDVVDGADVVVVRVLVDVARLLVLLVLAFGCI